jgi:hypothetical protein
MVYSLYVCKLMKNKKMTKSIVIIAFCLLYLQPMNGVPVAGRCAVTPLSTVLEAQGYGSETGSRPPGNTGMA